MSKARSPNYPVIGLKEALDKVRAVYESDYQNALSREIAAQHMGYQSLNGKSLGVLAALLRYGLLDGRGNETRVSDLAVAILMHAPGDRERARGIQEAASKPELFQELDSRFNGGRASDQALRSYLVVTLKFLPVGADIAIRSYRETKALVDAESKGYDSGSEVLEEPDMPASAPVLAHPPAARALEQQLAAQPLADNEPYRLSLSRDKLGIHASLSTREEADELIAAVTAIKMLLKAESRLVSAPAHVMPNPTPSGPPPIPPLPPPQPTNPPMGVVLPGGGIPQSADSEDDDGSEGL